jgi:hypothetical protein
MSDRNWLEVISRISASEPIDLDSVLFDKKAVDIENLVADQGADQTAHSTLLWDRDDAAVSYLGVRVNERLADYTQAAFRLAAAALERNVTPIILTTLPDCGFERFGFRVERIVGATEEELSLLENELKQFWNLAIIIDISEVAKLG